jgi:ABC-type transport system involved in cytochrome bd biosynthesis fused ATPase/permease subunit
MIAAQISLLIGILFLGFFIFISHLFLLLASLLFLTLLAPLLAIFSHAITLRFQNSKKPHSIAIICILCVPLLIWIIEVISFTLPYLYTPPAITKENYKYYNRCVAFVKSQSEYEDYNTPQKLGA